MTTKIYTLSLHDALPILLVAEFRIPVGAAPLGREVEQVPQRPDQVDVARVLALLLPGDRKSTRLNSSHRTISYAVFCLKKKTYHAANTYTRMIGRRPLFT